MENETATKGSQSKADELEERLMSSTVAVMG
jgi:hypothetical protein